MIAQHHVLMGVLAIGGIIVLAQAGALPLSIPGIPATPTLLRGSATPEPPACVYNAAEPHIVLAYVRPFDESDRSTDMIPHLRSVIETANGHIRHSAEPLGWRVDLRVLCEQGTQTPVVRNIVLPTSTQTDTNTSMRADILASGQIGAGAKVLAHYDGITRPGVGGEADGKPLDSRPGPENLNNQPGTIASIYGIRTPAATVYVHELLHAMGAVIVTAPHADGTGHCWQQGDFLCNAQPPAGQSAQPCSPARVDCWNDDYFHPNPPAGSYLASHWNVGGPSNRYIERSPIPESSVIPTVPLG